MMDEVRFEALRLDGEPRLPPYLSFAWMLVPTGVALGYVAWSLLRFGEVRDSWEYLPLTAIWVAVYFYALWHSHRPFSRYASISSDKIRLHLNQQYDTSIPFDAIERIAIENKRGIRVNLSRVLLNGGLVARGEHIAIYTKRRIKLRAKAGLFSGYKRLPVRLRKPEEFLALANDGLTEWRREHPPTG